MAGDVLLSRTQQGKALMRGRRDAVSQRRDALPHTEMREAARALAQGGVSGAPRPDLAGFLTMAFACMLRAGAVERLRPHEVSWVPGGASDLGSFVVTCASKTVGHVDTRGQWVPQGAEERRWGQALRELVAGRGLASATAPLASRAERQQMLEAVRATSTASRGRRWNWCNVRPGGNTFWVAAEMPHALRQAAGAWSQASRMAGERYTDVGVLTAQAVDRAAKRGAQLARYARKKRRKDRG